MEVKCPQCASRFNLPDAAAKPGAKLRCAVCKTVFALPGAAPGAPQPDAQAAPSKAPRKETRKEPLPELGHKRKGRSKLWLILLLLLLLAGGGAGAYYYFFMNRETPPSEADIAKKVELLTMRNVRQYNVLNEKVGKVFVIEGRVVNEFPEPKELIALEGAIYDKDKKPLSVKKQLAGTQLSLFQLQVLSEKEMEAFLNNKVEILTNNTNVPPGGEVPFMILFYDPPDDVAEFGVKIVDVKNADSK
ncbi:MAG: zinc-ribbon domain-containing protein [Desulfovibrio sp.]|nr:zinc-ribbon domain-containing protein [Desulfovibrio sp.]